jgi:hypothetical protein
MALPVYVSWCVAGRRLWATPEPRRSFKRLAAPRRADQSTQPKIRERGRGAVGRLPY